MPGLDLQKGDKMCLLALTKREKCGDFKLQLDCEGKGGEGNAERLMMHLLSAGWLCG